MSDEYILTQEQQRAWSVLLEQNAPRGAKAKMAASIAAAEKKSDSASWKTIVSGFFKGQQKELRAIFEYPKRIRAAEQGLGIQAGRLRAWLEEVRGAVVIDGPFDMRLSGFEDYGPLPVVDGYFAPLLGRSEAMPPPREGASSMPRAGTGGALQIDEIVGHAMPQTPAHAFAIVICADPGFGKSTTLRLLHARLKTAGVVVTVWQPGIDAPGGVLLCDDLDLLEAGQRSLLCKKVHDSKCVLLTATSAHDSLSDLPRYRVVYTLQAGEEWWSLEYLSHLEKQVQRLNRKVSLSPLRDWIERDLFAPGIVGRLDNLGLLARHVAEGGKLPPRFRDLAGWAVARAAAQARRRGHAAVALLIEQCGRHVLQAVAAEACRLGSLEAPMQTLLNALQAAISTSVPEQKPQKQQPKDSIVFEAAEELCHGLFRRRGDSVLPTQPACAVSALGGAIAEGRAVNQTLLEQAVLSPAWSEALLAAAEHLGDGCAILSALVHARSAVLCHAIPALTRLLAADVHFEDANVYREVFLLCLSVWSRWPADVRARTMVIMGPVNAAPMSVNHERLVAGLAPLLVLARASLQHRRLLPNEISHEEIVSGRHIPEPLKQYMGLLQTPELTDEQAGDAIGLGAPFQSPALLSPEFWQRLPPYTDTVGDMPAGFKIEDYSSWWRIAAASRLHELPSGEERVAGTHPDHTIRAALSQTPAGCQIWKQALISQIKKRHPRAAEVFAEAALSTLDRGGRWNADTLQSVWDGVTDREPLRRAVFERLMQLESAPWQNSIILPWLISIVVVGEERVELWKQWIERTPQNVGWKLFLDAGLPALHVAQWSLAAHSLAAKSNHGGPKPWLYKPAKTVEGSALDALLRSEDLAVLECLLRSPDRAYSSSALEQLASLTSDPARKIRLRLAAEFRGMVRLQLLQGLLPRADEEDAWHCIATNETSPLLSLVFQSLCALIRSDEEPWARAINDLALVAALVSDAPGWSAQLVDRLQEFGVPVTEEELRQLQIRSEEELSFRLIDLAWIVDTAEKQGPDPRPLIEAIMACDPVRQRVGAGRHAALWQTAFRSLGRDRIVTHLLSDHAALSPCDGTKIRLTAFTVGEQVQVEFVHSLLSDPDLGPPAARALVQTAYRQKPALLIETLDKQPQHYLIKPTPAWAVVVAALLDEYLLCAPDAALHWIAKVLRPAPKAVRRALWGELIPKLKPGPHRVQGLVEYFAAS